MKTILHELYINQRKYSGSVYTAIVFRTAVSAIHFNSLVMMIKTS